MKTVIAVLALAFLACEVSAKDYLGIGMIGEKRTVVVVSSRNDIVYLLHIERGLDGKVNRFYVSHDPANVVVSIANKEGRVFPTVHKSAVGSALILIGREGFIELSDLPVGQWPSEDDGSVFFCGPISELDNLPKNKAKILSLHPFDLAKWFIDSGIDVGKKEPLPSADLP